MLGHKVKIRTLSRTKIELLFRESEEDLGKYLESVSVLRTSSVAESVDEAMVTRKIRQVVVMQSSQPDLVVQALRRSQRKSHVPQT